MLGYAGVRTLFPLFTQKPYFLLRPAKPHCGKTQRSASGKQRNSPLKKSDHITVAPVKKKRQDFVTTSVKCDCLSIFRLLPIIAQGYAQSCTKVGIRQCKNKGLRSHSHLRQKHILAGEEGGDHKRGAPETSKPPGEQAHNKRRHADLPHEIQKKERKKSIHCCVPLQLCLFAPFSPSGSSQVTRRLPASALTQSLHALRKTFPLTASRAFLTERQTANCSRSVNDKKSGLTSLQ